MRVPISEKDLPDKWYNIVADLGAAAPTIVSSSGYPLGRHDLSPLASVGIADHELEKDRRELRIPDDLRDIYALWRPTALFRAERFEEALGTPARIFYKYESFSSTSGHEANTAFAQAYYASKDGVKRLVTASANGEWGAALAIACNRFDIPCRIYLADGGQGLAGFGKHVMEVLGAEVVLSPSSLTNAGKAAQGSTSAASLGLALSEAFEDAMSDEEAKFSIGTVMNHVLLHQTLIGQEAKRQMRRAKASPDILIGAVGGGSQLGGLIFPFYRDILKGTRAIAVETAAAPSLSRGRLCYDSVDSQGLAPMLRMYTLGRGYVPPGIYAGGMRYHGMSPLISALYREQRIEARTHTQREAFDAAVRFARAEGLIPAPESAYAVKAVIDEALACKESGERKDILFVLNASSNLDLDVFTRFLAGGVEDEQLSEDGLQQALDALPQVEAV